MPKDVIARDFTINLRKRLHAIGEKKRAPRAISAIKKFASINMGIHEKDIKIDQTLNKKLWLGGCGQIPGRMRIRVSRLRKTEEGQEKKFYLVVSHVEVPRNQLRHMKTETVEEQVE